jgi:hypothetical protein
MSEDKEIRAAMLADIHAHIREYGCKEWNRVKDKYRDVPDRTFWRIVAKVKKGVPDDAILEGRVKKAKIELQAELDLAPQGAKNKSSNPAPINIMRRLAELLDDIAFLRECSASVENGRRVMKNPAFFALSLRLEREVIQTSLNAAREACHLERVEEFQEALMAALEKTDPDVAQAVAEHLMRVGQERGMLHRGRF